MTFIDRDRSEARSKTLVKVVLELWKSLQGVPKTHPEQRHLALILRTKISSQL